ncbi:unnamed protein product, partial [marine sediment metagenome]
YIDSHINTSNIHFLESSIKLANIDEKSYNSLTDKPNIEAINAIGIANKRWINCVFEGNNPIGKTHVDIYISPMGNGSNYFQWIVPLLMVIDGKNLIITKTKIGLKDADANNRVEQLRLIGWNDHDSYTVEITDNTDLTSIQEKIYDHADITCGGVYEKMQTNFHSITNADYGLDISYVQVEYYYA